MLNSRSVAPWWALWLLLGGSGGGAWASPLAWSGAEQAYLDSAAPIPFAVDPNWLPIEGIHPETGAYEGIAAEILQRLSVLTGLTFELVTTQSWSESVAAVKEGRALLLPAVSITPERRQFLHFSAPFLELKNAAIMRQQAPFISTMHDLAGSKVGVKQGNSLHQYLSQSHPELTLAPQQDSLQALRRLQRGELDLYMDTQEVASYLINHHRLEGLKMVMQLDFRRELHLGLHHSLPPELLSLLNKALAAISPDERGAFYSRWVSFPGSGGYDYRPLWRVVTVAGAALLFILGWVYHLRRTQRALQQEMARRHESEEMFRNMFENHSSVMYLVDTESLQILDANRSAQQFYGYSHAEFITKNLADLNVISMEELFALRKVYIDDLGWSYQPIQHTLASGEIRDLEVYTSKIDYSGKSIYFTTLYDVTEKLRYEAELKSAKREAERSNQVKSQFLANMSHEIRTPMNAVIGMTYLALQQPLPPKAEHYLQKVHRAAESLLRIINDTLDVSKIEAGKLTIERTPFSLLQVLQNIESMLELRAEQQGITFRLELAPSLPDALEGDPLRLEQVLLNLGSNAVKFTEQGGVMIRVRTQSIEPQRVVLRFSIIDSGIGMTPEQLGRLFKPFSQADGSTTRRYGGTGLGLAISKSLIEMMGGAIWVHSELGVGSRFHFTLPLIPLAELPRSEQSATPNLGSAFQLLHGKRVLLVEDNEINQELVSELLQQVGIEVGLTNHGSEALQLLKREHPDAILMDLQMPVMDGYETTVAIRQQPQWQSLPIIAMTANVMQRDLDRARECGMNDTLAKPIEPQRLISTLLRWLAPEATDPATPLVREVSDSDTPPDWVAALTLFETQTALVNMKYKYRLYHRLLQRFLQQLQQLLQEFDLLWQQQSWVSLRLKVHSLKGVVATVGVARLQPMLAELERQLSGDKVESGAVESLWQSVRQQLLPLVSELQQLPSQPEAVEPPEEPSFAMDTALERLQTLLQQYDSEAIELVNGLLPKLERTGEVALAKQLAVAVNSYQFEQADEIVALWRRRGEWVNGF
ncbi:response regulator [Ectothiorhodospiraceae bacterium BW-2]|nr:response regulator [Ectothiorhodospiraceae bacterium BW-2]